MVAASGPITGGRSTRSPTVTFQSLEPRIRVSRLRFSSSARDCGCQSARSR